jgi:uncharacterized NAD(P)/FAD-binding protein YdhS
LKNTSIIGGGFAGTITAVQMIYKLKNAARILLISDAGSLNKGFAYNTYSKKHLLNVITAKMSAFADKPDHFLDWIMKREEFSDKDRTLIANAFLPRQLYGEYLTSLWIEAMETAKSKNISVEFIDSKVVSLEVTPFKVKLTLANKTQIEVDNCVIATGNNIPGNPKITNASFFPNKNYFQNPWLIESVLNTNSTRPILIIGNGLTMVDTVLGLIENGFKGEIYSLSPNGFNILPHRHNGLKYTRFTEELTENISLLELVKLIHKHIKSVREYGVSAEPVIDSIRPHTQRIWRNLTDKEKQMFMLRLRHLWGVARHRIPLHTHDKIQQLRIDGKLHILSGRIINFSESGDTIFVDYFDKKVNCLKTIETSRIINCTGPETDLMKLENSFLKNCHEQGTIIQDKLRLGIRTNIETFEVINSKGDLQHNLYTLGSNLKGELWESTAVNELRDQAERLASRLTLL